MVDLVLLLMGFSRAGVRNELDRFMKNLSQHSSAIRTYSKSAFTQYRQKLNPAALMFLMRKHLEYFNTHAQHKKLWHGYRVVAIDGSSLNMPNEPSLTDHFGKSKNQSGSYSTTGRISVAYDVMNKLMLDAQISHMKTGEHALAVAHLPYLSPEKDVLVFDRGYPGLNFARMLHEQGFKFCFRLSTAWKEAYKLLDHTDDLQWSLKKGKLYKEHRIQYSLKEDIEGFRLVKLRLANGQYVVLLTNLTDKEAFPLELLNELYRLRWTIEECYKRIKLVAQLEYFSGKTPIAIEQDFYSRIIMLNISAMIETQELEPQLDQVKTTVHRKQTNRTQVMLKLKEFAFELLWSINPEVALRKMLLLLYQCYEIVRPDRHFTRNRGFRFKRKMLKYKA